MTNDDLDLLPEDVLMDAMARRGGAAVVVVLHERVNGPEGHEVRWRCHGAHHVLLGLMADMQARMVAALRAATL